MAAHHKLVLDFCSTERGVGDSYLQNAKKGSDLSPNLQEEADFYNGFSRFEEDFKPWRWSIFRRVLTTEG